MRIAVCRTIDNVAENTIIADVSDLPPDGCFLVDIDNLECDLGWIYDGATFSPPSGPAIQPDEPPVSNGD